MSILVYYSFKHHRPIIYKYLILQIHTHTPILSEEFKGNKGKRTPQRASCTAKCFACSNPIKKGAVTTFRWQEN
jgi:hypothetical protein